MNYTQLLSDGIKRLRVQAGLTQEKFAEMVNLSINGLRNIEQGKYAPNAKTIESICKVFKISPVQLLLPIDDNEIEKLIINKVKSLSEEQQLKLNKFLNANII